LIQSRLAQQEIVRWAAKLPVENAPLRPALVYPQISQILAERLYKKGAGG
jgi:hypothetical protein